ncbi:hypothetical protein [Streptomyces sp. NPDC093094]|uniref:hypothetical protein n=1 Tax=Streptomyces sp. NPDC093094 TaxID=3366026 RepID=UPI0037F5B2F0
MQRTRTLMSFMDDLCAMKRLVGLSYGRIEQLSERQVREGKRLGPPGAAGMVVLARSTIHRMLKRGDVSVADRPRVMTFVAVCLKTAGELGIVLPADWRDADRWARRWSMLVSESLSKTARPVTKGWGDEQDDDGSGEGDAPGLARLAPAEQLWPARTPEIAELATAIRHLGRSGRPEAAASHANELVQRCAQRLGGDHLGTLVARQTAAYWAGEAGWMREAARLTKAVCEDSRQMLGPHSPYTRLAERRLVYWVGTAGDWNGARHHANRLLTRWQGDPAVDALDLSLARIDALYADAQVRGWNSAVHYLRHEIPGLSELLGPNHPIVLWVRASVVEGLIRCGETAEATDCAVNLLEDTEGRFGTDHQRVLWARSALISVLRGSKRLSETVDVARVNAAEADRILGYLHPEAVKIKLTCAEALHDEGAVCEAREIGHELLATANACMGWDSLSMLRIRLALLKTGDTDAGGSSPVVDATPESLHADARRLLGPDHEVTLRVRLLHVSRSSAGARGQSFAELTEDCVRVLGLGHPLTAEVQAASEAASDSP